jgi:hypothetical protein
MKNRKKLFRRFCGLMLAFVLMSGFGITTVPPAEASAMPPTIEHARLITNQFIELHWQGQDYINGAGRSKEDTAADHRGNFEVRLDGTVLTQSEPWYWNITNLSLHGVRVNQNITTLRLSRALTSAQITAIQNGTSRLDVRITSANVRASSLTLNAGGLTGSTPNGAIPAAAIGAPGASANTTTRHIVVNRPYYTTTVVSRDGVPVRGSEHVRPDTVALAASQVDVILSAAPAALNSRLAGTSQFVIFGPGEHSYNIPEHRSIFLRDNWNRAEGYGGNTSATSAAGVTRQHILHAAQRPYPSSYATGYRNESILAHEFGHGIMNAMGHSSVTNPGSPTHMRGEIEAIYRDVIALPENPANPGGRLRWQGRDPGTLTYMSSNAHEFVATAVSIWFDAMAESDWQNNGRGPVNTREELRRYCPQSFNFFTRILPEQRQLSEAWGREVPNTRAPFFPPTPPEPAGRYGPSVKLMSAIAANPAGSGLQTYIPWNASANFTPAVELWWDFNTDLMRWTLEPDADENYFRIVRANNASYTRNSQRNDLVLMPADGGTAAGTEVVLARRSSSAQSQWWRFLRQADGQFIITNRANPEMAIVLRGNSTASGTRIELGALTAESARWRIDGNVPLVSEPFCDVCEYLEVACVCVFCDDCEQRVAECVCVFCDICDELEENCTCVYCEHCELLEADCICVRCRVCRELEEDCVRPEPTITLTVETALTPCADCDIKKIWTITVMTTYFCDGSVNIVTERRAAKRCSAGTLLESRSCSFLHLTRQVLE